MKKSKFIQSTIILIIGGFFTKMIGMSIKIIITRMLGTEGIGIYMLLSPTFMLLIALAQLGLPIAVSKLVSEKKHNNKQLIFSILPISFGINLFILLFLLFTSFYIANHLLNEPRSYFALICIGFVLPFISISSLIRGYFFGKQRMLPHVISNVAEDVIRLIVLVIGIPIFLNQGLEYAVAFVVLANIFSELTSILILIFCLPKNKSIQIEDLKPRKNNIKQVLQISLPTTGSRLIGNLGHFFEPIILTFVLLSVGYQNSFIVNEYGIVAGFVMPLLLIPAFFTTAISQALIPVVSHAFSNRYFDYAKKKVRQAILFSLAIGIPATIIFMMYPEALLQLLYNNNVGSHYLVVLAPIFLLYYIQSPLTSTLQAMGYAGSTMRGTFYGIVIKLSLLFALTYLKIGMWGLVIAASCNVLFVTIHHAIVVYRKFKLAK